MADVDLELRFDETDVIKGLDKTTKSLEGLNAGVEDLNTNLSSATDNAARDLRKIEKELDNTRKKTRETTAETNRYKLANQALSKALKEKVRSISVLGVNLGEVVDKLRGTQKATAGAAQGVGFLTKAWRVLQVAFAASVIGAIILALAGLIALVTKSQKGMDKLQQVVAALGAVMNVLVDRAVKLGGALVKLFTGDFRGALKDTKEAFTGLTAEVVKEALAAAELERRYQRLAVAQRELNVLTATRRALIEELRAQADDERRSFGDRRQLLEDAIEKETELEEERLRIARERLANLKAELALKDEPDNKELEEEAALLIEVANLEADIAAKRRSDQSKFNDLAAEANNLYRERKERLEEAAKAYREVLENIEERITKIRLERKEGIERAEFERKLALEELDRIEKLARARAAAAKVAFEAEEEFAELRKLINEEADKAVAEARLESTREQIEATADRLLAETELLSSSADTELTLEEYKARERVRIQKEAIQAFRKAAVQEFGEDSQEVLEIDVQIAQLEASDVETLKANFTRIQQEKLRAIEQQRQLGLLEVELLEENTDKVLTLEQEKAKKRLEIEVEALRSRRSLLAEEYGENSFELQQLDLTIKGLEKKLGDFAKIRLDPLTLLRKRIMDSLEIKEEDFQEIVGRVDDIFSSINYAVQTNREVQLQENERLIESINQRIETIEDALEREEDKQKEGLANNTDRLREELAKQQEERARAIAEREELEKKAARARVRRMLIEQGQNIVLGVTRIIAAESGKGLLALVTIGAALAGIFAAVAEARSQAANLQVPELREGRHLTDFGQILGPSHEAGGVGLLYADSQGRQRIVEAEGSEMLMGTKVSQRHLPFLKALNTGQPEAERLAAAYLTLPPAAVPVTDGLSPRINMLVPQSRQAGEQARTGEVEFNYRAMKEATREALQPYLEEGNALLERLTARPDRVSTQDGYLEITDTPQVKKSKRVRIPK